MHTLLSSAFEYKLFITSVCVFASLEQLQSWDALDAQSAEKVLEVYVHYGSTSNYTRFRPSMCNVAFAMLYTQIERLTMNTPPIVSTVKETKDSKEV